MYLPLLLSALVVSSLVPASKVPPAQSMALCATLPMTDEVNAADTQKLIVNDAIFLIQQLQALAREATSYGEFTTSMIVADLFYKDGHNSHEFLMIIKVVAKYFEQHSVNFSAKFNHENCLILISWATV